MGANPCIHVWCSVPGDGYLVCFVPVLSRISWVAFQNLLSVSWDMEEREHWHDALGGPQGELPAAVGGTGGPATERMSPRPLGAAGLCALSLTDRPISSVPNFPDKTNKECP